MQVKKRHPWIAVMSFLLFFITFTVHSAGVIDISIKNATPLVILPLLTAFSVFNKSSVSGTVGLIVGICMDSVGSGTLCFNAIVLMLSAVFISVISGSLFNRNIRAAVVLCILACLVYYGLRWLIFYAFYYSAQNNLTYLLSYAFPSIVYTSVFIFPFYFIFKYFNKIINS